jgi:hypothetical protein
MILAALILFNLAWDPVDLPQLPPPCPVAVYRVHDCVEDLCHPEECVIAAEVAAGKPTAVTLQIDDTITHVFFVTAIGACGTESYPSNQVFFDPNPQARQMTPGNFRSE